MYSNQNLKTATRRHCAALRLFTRAALASAVLLGATSGCAVVAEGEIDDDAAIGTVSQALTVRIGPDLRWGGPQSLGTVPGATGTPAVASGCSSAFVVFTRVGYGGRYRGAADGDTEPSAWATYAPRSFASSPALTALPDHAACTGLRFMVVGRGAGSGANTRNYWSDGHVTRGSDFVFNPPAYETYFAEVSSREFSGDNGYPAVTSSPGGTAHLAFRDGQNIYAHTKGADSTIWGAEQRAPLLPGGWTPVGTPAIEQGFIWGPVIVVRAQKDGQTAFFSIVYKGFFSRWSSRWYNLGSPPSGSAPVESDPALEWNGVLSLHTLYYRSGDSYYQKSFYISEWENDDTPAMELINSSFQPSYDSAPSALGNIDIEQGKRHLVVGRSGSEILASLITTKDDNLERHQRLRLF